MPKLSPSGTSLSVRDARSSTIRPCAASWRPPTRSTRRCCRRRRSTATWPTCSTSTPAAVRCLHTAEFMTAAVAMYLGMGFRRVPSFDFDVGGHLRPGGGRPVRVIAFRLDLPTAA